MEAISLSWCLLYYYFANTSHYDDVIMGAMASQITSHTIVYSAVYSDADQRKHQSSASLSFVWGIHQDRWIPRTNGQYRGKCFIWWRHHEALTMSEICSILGGYFFNNLKQDICVPHVFLQTNLCHSMSRGLMKTNFFLALKVMSKTAVAFVTGILALYVLSPRCSGINGRIECDCRCHGDARTSVDIVWPR